MKSANSQTDSLNIEKFPQNFQDVREAYRSFLNYKNNNNPNRLKQFKRWEYFWENRIYPNGEFPTGFKLLDELKNFKKRSDQLQASPIWNELGPRYIALMQNPRVAGNGRINAVWQNPAKQTNFLIGAASGGIWKTIDRFNTWQAVGLSPLISIGIADIASSPTEPDIVYAATGDGNGWLVSRSYSVGIIKSIDGGSSWATMLTGIALKENMLIGRIVVHPENADIVFAGTNNGIIKSMDGGVTWAKMLDSVFIRDIEFFPALPDIIYASSFTFNGNAKIYRSTDVGETWTEIAAFPSAERINLAVSIDSPNWIYALCTDYRNSGFEGLYLSKDAGTTWAKIITNPEDLNLITSQGYYNLAFWVDPADKNHLFAGGIELWESTDGGVTWANHNSDIHVDHHYLYQTTDGGSLIDCSDGGIYEYNLIDKDWRNVSGGLSITQFYKMCSSPFHDRIIFAGSQDNGTVRSYMGRWEHVSGGDGMECVASPDNAQIVYASMQGGTIFISTDGGKRFYNSITNFDFGESKPWLANFMLNPSNSSELFVGYENVWKTTDTGKNWTKLSDFTDGETISALAINRINTNIIYAAKKTELFISSDSGATWSKVNSFPASVTSIEPDDNFPDRYWVTLSGYIVNEKVYEINSGTITNISGNLPDVPVSTIVQDKRTGKLYVGTDIGIFVKTGSGLWENFSGNMPPAIISELEVHYQSGNLRAATFGRGLWETKLYDCLVSKPILNESGNLIICRGDSVLLEVTNPGNYEYVWSNGVKGKSVYAKAEGSYFVKAVAKDECIRTSEMVTIEILPRPDVRIITLGPYPVCEGGTVFLNAFLENTGNETYSFEWSNGEKGRTIGVSEEGIYTVSVLSSNGCIISSAPFDFKYYPETPVPKVLKSGSVLISEQASAYQWYYNSEKIEGAVERELEISSLGAYFVEITDSNGCRNFSLPVTVFINESADTNHFLINVYPNPTQKDFVIESYFNTLTDVTVTLYDVLGKIAIEEKWYKKKGYSYQKLETAHLPAGTYYLNISGNGISEKILLVKKN